MYSGPRNFPEISIEWILIGISAVLLLANIVVYRRNIEFANSDLMGAMFHWHIGFYLSWLPVVIITFMGHILPWWSGFIALIAAPVASYLLWFPVDLLLTKTGLARKPLPGSAGYRDTH